MARGLPAAGPHRAAAPRAAAGASQQAASHLTAKLAAEKTASGIFRLCERRCDEFNAVHGTTALYRLAKSGCSPKTLEQGRLRRLLASLAAHADRGQLTPRSAATAAWSLAALRSAGIGAEAGSFAGELDTVKPLKRDNRRTTMDQPQASAAGTVASGDVHLLICPRGPLAPLLAAAGRPIKASDASFQEWCTAALAATSSTTRAIDEQDRLTLPRAFKGIWDYKFTGALRPALVTPQMRMPDSIAKPDYALEPRGICHSERTLEAQTVIPALAGEDLDAIRAAGRLGREVLDIAAGFLRPGVTGDEIDRLVSQACVDRCIYPSPLNYYGFPKSLCVSPNEVIAHGIPNCRPFEDGDIVNLDVTIYHRGFHADLNETYFIGKVCEDGLRTVQAAYNALRSATKLIRPGALYRDLGNAIQTEAERYNCAVVREYSGHGIGRLFHGCPRIPHYRRNKAVGKMKVGEAQHQKSQGLWARDEVSPRMDFRPMKAKKLHGCRVCSLALLGRKWGMRSAWSPWSTMAQWVLVRIGQTIGQPSR
ncbi:unnamed protein product [Prorocentrum cordatum]|uniref:Methionine aminopeptidase n=1 Tax=Prorocentrum cordatum TaxID=2364126 RepID=A0ABN9THW3_9DINO|nr:unnamed protein product [Polarella glacialis]